MLVIEVPFWKIAALWLCLFSWLPSILYLQSFNLGLPASFNIRCPCKHPPPPSSPFSRITGRDCTCTVIFNLGGQGFCMYSGNTSKKSKKAAIFCLNIPLTKSIDHPWGSWERGSEMERHVLSSNNSYLHPFLPLCCCVVVGHTSALFLGELLRLKLFYASTPRAPIWKLVCVSFHTLLSYGKKHSVVLPFTSFFCECILWGVLHLVTNRSRKDD